MAWASVGTLGTFANTTTNQASFTLTTSAALEAGNVGVLIIAADNHRTTDGDDVLINGSITDSAGNTWLKAHGHANGQSAALAGTCVEVWYCKVVNTLASGGTISGNYNDTGDRDASCGTAWEFTCAGGVSVQAVNQNVLDGGTLTSIAALDATTPNAEFLRIRGVAGETNITTAMTKTAAFGGVFTPMNSGTGTASGEQIVRGEWAISTGTGLSSDPTLATTTADWATVYVALKEVIVPVTVNLSGLGVTSAFGSAVAWAASAPAEAGDQQSSFVGAGIGGVIIGITSVPITVSLTGIGATSALGTLSIGAKAVVTLTGLGAASSVGTPTIAAKAITTLTGLGAASGIGTPTVAAKATAPLTGLDLTSGFSVGTITGKAIVTPTGIGAASATGAPVVTGKANFTLDGIGAASGLGALTIAGKAEITLVGQAATSAFGALGVAAKAIVTLTGQAATSAVGTLTVAGKAIVALIGEQASSAFGTLTVTASKSLIAIKSLGVSTTETLKTIRARIFRQAEVVQSGEQTMHARTLARMWADVVNIATTIRDVVPLYLRPSLTIAPGGWTNELGGTSLEASVNEEVAEDVGYIQSGNDPVNDAAMLNLTGLPYGLTEPIILHVRARSIAGANLTAKLYDGAIEIASRDFTGLTDSFETFDFVLTSGEAASMIAANDPRLALIADTP